MSDFFSKYILWSWERKKPGYTCSILCISTLSNRHFYQFGDVCMTKFDRSRGLWILETDHRVTYTQKDVGKFHFGRVSCSCEHRTREPRYNWLGFFGQDYWIILSNSLEACRSPQASDKFQFHVYTCCKQDTINLQRSVQLLAFLWKIIGGGLTGFERSLPSPVLTIY